MVHIRSRPREKRSSDTLLEDPGLLDVTVADDSGETTFELRPNHDLVSRRRVERPRVFLLFNDMLIYHRCYSLPRRPPQVSPVYSVTVREGGEARHEERGEQRACTFIGHALSDPDTAAALSNCDGRGYVSTQTIYTG